MVQFDFDERLAMSSGIAKSIPIQDILMKNVHGILRIEQADSLSDRNGTDWWLYHRAGHCLSVDAKVRQIDYSRRGQDDLALEVWSVKEQGITGWTLRQDKRTDYILWYWIDTGRWCLVPFGMLSKVFQERLDDWSNEYKHAEQHTPWGDGSYTSECLFVPRKAVWAAIYRRFSGIPEVNDASPAN
jgi:hypothetical protein